MKYWKEYEGHIPSIRGTRKKFDNTIYTFDIETSSYLILNNKQIPAINYLKLSKKEQEECIFQSNMYIWQFSINNEVYYGRTWNELMAFMYEINYYVKEKKYVFVHNFAYEFEFMRNKFNFKNVFARKSRKPIRAEIEGLNFEFRCSYMMSNSSLEMLPKIYSLPVEKKVGELDYSLIRNSKTELTSEELEYCEYDCLVVYEYIKKELETYHTIKNLPITSTGHVRKELKNQTMKDYDYRNIVRKSINIDGHIYNLLIKAFAGGYTHANWIYTDKIVKNVSSFDFTSSYPYVMVTHKFPATRFQKVYIKEKEKLDKDFAYLIHVKFKNIRCKYYNNFISVNKCLNIHKGRYDNGRLIGADEIEIVLTDIDFYLIDKTYEFDSYEFIEVYSSFYDYLPKKYIEFILEKYKNKTEYKNVKGKETEYALEKAKFNSLYGMTVTNNIKDEVTFDNESGWKETKITNEEILEKLEKEKEAGFLSFSYGVWVTAWARYNLLMNLIQLDEYEVYADTDSLKLKEGFDINVINRYNKYVENKIENVSKELEIPIEKFKPKDTKGKEHLLGVFDSDAHYDEFITQGAKKYAYIDSEDKEIHITVAGVPKKGSKALKNLNDFRDDFVFDYKDTGKNLLIYNDEMQEFELEDYQGNKEIQNVKYGAVLVPTTYELGKAEEYAYLISDDSSARAIFEEGRK